MAKLKDLKVTIGLSKRGLTKLNADLRRTKSNFRRNFGEITAAAKNAAFVIGGVLVSAVASVIKAGADMERLEVGFRSIAGGAEQASKMVARLNQFAVSTPFQINDISRSARQLLAVGTREDQLTSRLRMLGDIAAASGNQIGDIAAIFAKVKAKGKVELESLNQLAERGIPIFDQLRKVTGDANMEFGAGKVKLDDFNAALAQMNQEGGFAENAMANLSTTISGQLTTAIDTLKVGLADIGESSGLLDIVSGSIKLFTIRMKQAFGMTEAQTKAVTEDVSKLMKDANAVTVASFTSTEEALKNYRKELVVMRLGTKEGGNDFAFLTDKIGLLDAAIKTLNFNLDNNADTFNDAARAFQEYNDAGSGRVSSLLTDSLEEQFVTAEDLAEAFADLAKAQENIQIDSSMLEEVALDPEAIDEADAVAESFGKRLIDLRDRAKSATEAINAAFQATAQSLAVTLGVGIGSALAGTEDAFRSLGNTALMTLASLAVEGGKIAVGVGIAIEGIKKALSSLNPAVALAAGIALIALGSAAKVALQGAINKRAEANIPQMAEGGIFSGASLAMVGEGPGTSSINPEVVAPLDKLKNMIGGGNVNVTGTIRGRDLLLSEERSAYSRRRRFGN